MGVPSAIRLHGPASRRVDSRSFAPRRYLIVAILLSFAAAASPARAQSVRGVVVDDSTKLPVEGATITLVDAASAEVVRTTRSDSSGNFMVHAGRPGTYRVRAARIGYQPLTSEAVRLGIGQLAVMRLRMATLAQRLVPVRITERRPLKAAELMSTTGFDLRESKGLGMFLSGDRLTSLKQENLREILDSEFRPTLYVQSDPDLGDVLTMRQGAIDCAPEIFLDGRLLSEATSSRGDALATLGSLRAADLHGIEVYRGNQLLPASLGGWFGVTRSSLRPCGTVAVWTRSGFGVPMSIAGTRRISGVQVITGTVVSYDTGLPVAGVPLTLLSDAKDPVEPTVKSDDRGEFTIRTDRAGTLRLHAASIGYAASTSAPIALTKDELVAVRVFVSPTQPVMTPLGVAARVTPQMISATSMAGFTYRRERQEGGTYFRADDIAALGARRIADLVRSMPAVRMAGTAPADTITLIRGDDLPRCRPAYFIDGRPVGVDTEAVIGALAMERVFGVEVYPDPATVPQVFADLAPECGVIAIWMKR